MKGLPEGAPYRAAVFDLDGTLLDSFEAIHDSVSEVLSHFGLPAVSLAQTRRLVGNGLEVLVARILPPDLREEGIERFRARYRVYGPRLTTLMPGTEALLSELSSRGVGLAIASNKPAQFSRQLLDGIGLGRYFCFIGGPDLGYRPKPAPEMVLAALAALAVPPAQVLFVGDMQIDVETARAAGMPVAVLPTGAHSRDELEVAHPDVLVKRLLDLLPLF